MLLNFRDCNSPLNLTVPQVWKVRKAAGNMNHTRLITYPLGLAWLTLTKEINSVLSAMTVHGGASKAEVLDGENDLAVAFGKPILHVIETSMSNCFGLKELYKYLNVPYMVKKRKDAVRTISIQNKKILKVIGKWWRQWRRQRAKRDSHGTYHLSQITGLKSPVSKFTLIPPRSFRRRQGVPSIKLR